MNSNPSFFNPTNDKFTSSVTVSLSENNITSGKVCFFYKKKYELSYTYNYILHNLFTYLSI
ncbi:unnamed protein product [Schistosoma mattheei]|uniref:Uncharacterized protein n=1 Tax=Schistosoma mattheei TaxID=31246 RepID=A0A3P8H9R3_9TREM|nr:unnamed protein product [Schistosoma mattheei]